MKIPHITPIIHKHHNPFKIEDQNNKERRRISNKVIMQKLEVHEKKLNALARINHAETIQDSVKNQPLKFMPKAIFEYVQTRLERTVLDVIKKNLVNLFRFSSTPSAEPTELELKPHWEKKMKRRKGDGGSSSKKKKSPTDTSNYERFKDDDKPRQEQEEVAQHDAFTGEHAHWFKQPGEKRVKLPEQNWFNELVNADKDPREYELQIGSTVMFAKSMQNFLNKEKITKEDLKGPTFELLKNRFKNNIELEYNMEQ
ncbi:hypothetical protein Tco_1454458, partial [Tanacetum coccineum]